MTENQSEPFFIVGAPRSGTTLLAVLLDRHPLLAIPPETQFYTEFVAKVDATFWQQECEQVVATALAHPRIADLQLDPVEVTGLLEQYGRSPAGLLRALLDCYSRKRGMARVGEKSPRHNEHVATILNDFPRARIVALVRDGRDVVNSMIKAPWAAPGNPRRFLLFCRDWMVQMRHVERNQQRVGSGCQLIVKYEDLLHNPEVELRQICRFLDTDYEPCMLDTSVKTAAVPEWESEWKSKATMGLDATRIGAWQRERTREQIWKMNTILGPMLRRHGYANTTLRDCPPLHRLKLMPYIALRWEPLRPFAVFLLRFGRKMMRIARPGR
ncbi:MAG: sulfotransferase [Gammaproteobacteria bacterium]|nr:sulfotransferase [Gammaproteobacteria bacterium]